MAVKQKNREAAEFKNRAEARMTELRSKLADLDTKMTTDELTSAETEIKDLQRRAALVGGFTPQEEIDDQGGDELLRRAAPDSGDPDVKSATNALQKYSEDAKKHFGHMDNFLRAVTHSNVHAGLSPAQKQVLLRSRQLSRRIFGMDDMETRTIVGTASDASGGEYLLPLQQDPSIFQVANEQVGMVQYATRYPVTGRTLRIPYVVQTDGANTRPLAGIAAITIVGEGGAKPVREPKFLQRLLAVYKWAAISKIGDEVLADDFTGDMAPTVTRLVGGQVLNELNDYMTVVGSGTSEPMAALHASNTAIIVVNRETSQSVTANDIFAMYSRHTHGPRSYWSCSRRVIEKLFALTLGSNTLVTMLPDLRGKPQLMLLGYPVVINDFQPTIGVKSDLALINPEFYALAMRTQLTVESSIHVEFVNDITTYRFFARAGGIPIPDGTYAYKAVGSVKVDEHSPFTVLGDDATS